MKHIAILGEGAWGTAIATVLAHNGHHVRLWCYHSSIAREIKETRINSTYLPGIILDDYIEPTVDLSYALENTKWVLEVIPVVYLRSILMQVRPYYNEEQIWVSLSKGIEDATLMFPTHMIDDVFKKNVSKAVLSGPGFAQEVARKEITATCLAAQDATVSGALQTIFTNNYFRPDVSTDLEGVQMCGALKNVLSLGVGLLDGAGYGDNTKAFFFTKSLREIERLVIVAGGQQETVYGLAGVGDAVLTAMGTKSRNVMIGKRLGMGISLETIVDEMGSMPEGINTVKSILKLAQKHSIDVPIFHTIHEIVFNQLSIDTLIAQLLVQ